MRGPGLKLKDVKTAFPLPGEYHFRFKMKWESVAQTLALGIQCLGLELFGWWQPQTCVVSVHLTCP